MIGATTAEDWGRVPSVSTASTGSVFVAEQMFVADRSGRPRVRDASFAIRGGELVGIVAVEGAGQRELLRALAGRYALSAGRLQRPAVVGFVPEDRRIFSDLTVLENLDIGRQPVRHHPDGRPTPSWTPEKLFAIFPNLGAMPDRRGAHMSGGEQQMLTVARTLMGNPLLVLLDEPSEGVAPVIVEQMANTIIELKKEGLSVLLSEQNIHFAELVCDRAYVLEKGQLQWHGPMAELAKDIAAQRRLLSV